MVSNKLLSVDHAAKGILKVDSLDAAEKTEIVDPCAGLLLYWRVTALLIAMFIRSIQFTYVGSVRNTWKMQSPSCVCEIYYLKHLFKRYNKDKNLLLPLPSVLV